MADIEVTDDDPAEAPYRRFGIPALGFENYWYPIITSREVARKPRAVRLVGRDIVLFRDAGKLFAPTPGPERSVARITVGLSTEQVDNLSQP
jgi:hypothetical protein